MQSGKGGPSRPGLVPSGGRSRLVAESLSRQSSTIRGGFLATD